ncbi:hypothetical protein [Dietzia natronolimnaea]|uniref:hypothetical protein n=1 Tax=Dietzia natronolimnaea TaxID=161920 RepID=UPI0015CB74E2|nr:hypothetical protein [Dietzia natronolimnaea]MBB1037132.1 hypothetical protein [Dietzia natronolimnaea]
MNATGMTALHAHADPAASANTTVDATPYAAMRPRIDAMHVVMVRSLHLVRQSCTDPESSAARKSIRLRVSSMK